MQKTLSPTFHLGRLPTVSITRKVWEVTDDAITATCDRMAEFARPYYPKHDQPAERGDRLAVAFNGEGPAEYITLGSGIAAPGLEDAFVGRVAGDVVDVTLAGPPSRVVQVCVLEVAAPGPAKITDEIAQRLKAPSAAALKAGVARNLRSHYDAMTSRGAKDALLDALDSQQIISLPAKLVRSTFDASWKEVLSGMRENGQTFEAMGVTVREAREKHLAQVKRHLRLRAIRDMGPGLGLFVSDEEAVASVMDNMGGGAVTQERLDAFRNAPEALAQLKASCMEDKVLDHLLSLVDVTDVMEPVS